MIIDQQEKKILNQCYKKLQDIISRDDKLIYNKSILPRYIRSNKKNLVAEEFEKAAIQKKNFSNSFLDSLEKNNLIRVGQNIEEYIITPKGIWEIETESDIINSEKLITYLDETFFDLSEHGNKPLATKEKVALLLLIGIRAFSESTCIKIDKDNMVLEALNKSIEKCIKMLLEWEAIESPYSVDDFFYSKHRKTAVDQIYTRDKLLVDTFHNFAKDIPKKTKGWWKSLNDRRYFLDISLNNVLNFEKIRFLVSKLFNDSLPTDKILEIKMFLDELSQEMNTIMYDAGENIFIGYETTQKIEDALYGI